MTSRYVTITREQMEEVLGIKFHLVPLKDTKELVYGKRVDVNGVPLTLRVYTSIDSSGVSRDCGQDAIRVCLVTRNNGKPVWVGGSRRVNRVPNWQERLTQRIQEWQDILGPLCPSCGAIMKERKSKRGKFWGCTQYPACRGTVDIK